MIISTTDLFAVFFPTIYPIKQKIMNVNHNFTHVLSNQPSKLQRDSVHNYIKQREVENPHTGEAVTSVWFPF